MGHVIAPFVVSLSNHNSMELNLEENVQVLASPCLGGLRFTDDLAVVVRQVHHERRRTPRILKLTKSSGTSQQLQDLLSFITNYAAQPKFLRIRFRPPTPQPLTAN
jgi:hypothetical protein